MERSELGIFRNVTASDNSLGATDTCQNGSLTLQTFHVCISDSRRATGAMTKILYCFPTLLQIKVTKVTLTEVFPCFFLNSKANARVKPAKMGHGSHCSKIFVLFYVLFVLCCSVYCLCINVYCTTATGWFTQFQLINTSYHTKTVH
jgi:hypothetical protein